MTYRLKRSASTKCATKHPVSASVPPRLVLTMVYQHVLRKHKPYGRCYGMKFTGLNPGTRNLIFNLHAALYSITCAFQVARHNSLHAVIVNSMEQDDAARYCFTTPPPPPRVDRQPVSLASCDTPKTRLACHMGLPVCIRDHKIA
jgi:hypothetical protein